MVGVKLAPTPVVTVVAVVAVVTVVTNAVGKSVVLTP
jgi:hypothetical protein